LENYDQLKYGSIRRSLIQPKSLDHDQFPKTIAEAYNVLSNHCFDLMMKKKGKEINKRLIGTNKRKLQSSLLLKWKVNATVT